MRFGIEFEPDADVSTQEKFQAYVDQKMAAQQAEYEAGQQQQEARRATRKKSPSSRPPRPRSWPRRRTSPKRCGRCTSIW